MKFIRKIKSAIEFGGIELPLLKLYDLVFKTDNASNYIYNREKEADISCYPKLIRALYGMYTGFTCDLTNPGSFGEKIQQWKLSEDLSVQSRLSDKYRVREWIAEKIGESYLIPLLGVWDTFDQIPFSKLPNSFVLKANHGSGWNIIVRDKSVMDIPYAKDCFDKWLGLNFAYISGLELQYEQIKPKIIAEEYIEEMDGDLKDYKIHCFNGEPRFIQIIGERNHRQHSGKESYVDLNWDRIRSFSNTYKQYKDIPQKPNNLGEMINIAKALSEGFLYVRVDLYNINDQIKFGEMTFTPASGYAKWANYIPEAWWK